MPIAVTVPPPEERWERIRALLEKASEPIASRQILYPAIGHPKSPAGRISAREDIAAWVADNRLSVSTAENGRDKAYRLYDGVSQEAYDQEVRWVRVRALLDQASGPVPLRDLIGTATRAAVYQQLKDDLEAWVTAGRLSVSTARRGNAYRLYDGIPQELYEREARWEAIRARLAEASGPVGGTVLGGRDNASSAQRLKDDLTAWVADGRLLAWPGSKGRGLVYELNTTEDFDMPALDARTLQPITQQALAFLALPGSVGNARPRLGLITAYYDAEMTERIRQVMGAGVWHGATKTRHWPLTTAGCRKLREAYGEHLERQPELRAWYHEQKAIEKQREADRAAELARKDRIRAEQVRLDAEQALYGSAASVGEMPMATVRYDEDGNPIVESVADLVPGAFDYARTPVVECPAVDNPWVTGGDTDDWRVKLQAEGAAWLSTNGSGVLVDEVGLGKSRTTLLAATDSIRALLGVHLIVAPLKVARLTWPKEIKRWVPEARIIDWPLGESSAAARQQRERALGWCKEAERGTKRPIFLIVNHHAVANHPGLHDVTWASVIVDEADQVLSIGHRGVGDTKIARGLMALKTHPDGLRAPTTGTPFRGKLGNLWGLLDFCAPGGFGPKAAFTDAYTTTAGEQGSGSTLDRVMPGREAAWSRLMGGWVLRRTRLAEQRALIDRRVEYVDPLPEQLAQDEVWKKRPVWTGIKRETDEFAIKGKVMMRKADGAILPDTIAAVTRRLQLAVGPMHDLDDSALIEGIKPTYKGSSPKIDWIITELGEWGLLEREWWHLAGETGKVIIASAFTAALDLLEVRLREHLPPDAWVRIDGSTSMKHLDAAKDAFSGPRGPGILLLSSTAGGAGLTLDEHCQRLIIMCSHWTEDMQVQVVGRIENRTWQAPREIVVLATKDTLDGYVAQRNLHQASVQDSTLELAHAG